MLDDQRADQRAEDGGGRPDAGEPALDLAALVHRIEVADDRHRRRLHRARADALKQAEGDQRRHRPSEAAKDRAGEEDCNPPQHHGLPAPKVGELAEHDGRGRLGEQKGGEHPAIELEAAELRRDLRHGGRNDGRLDGDHKIRRHHRGEDKRAMRREGGHRALHRGAPLTCQSRFGERGAAGYSRAWESVWNAIAPDAGSNTFEVPISEPIISLPRC